MGKVSEKQGFAQRFREAVETAFPTHKTRRELGKLFGVSGVVVTYWWHGQQMPPLSRVLDIARKLNVSPEWLLTGRGQMRLESPPSQDTQLLIAAFNSLPPAAKAELLGYLAYIVDRQADKKQSLELRKMAENYWPGVIP